MLLEARYLEYSSESSSVIYPSVLLIQTDSFLFGLFIYSNVIGAISTQGS